jgi:hypothetical protein
VGRIPGGKAPNLVVLVHGCCTDANDVINDWDSFGALIAGKIIENNTPGRWEIVVLDWSDYTPKRDYNPLNLGLNKLIIDANTAYDNAADQPDQPGQGSELADAIDPFSIYKYIHLIGHSAGAKLIDEAAKRLAELKNQKNAERPFIHLTFLDAYTRTKEDSGEVGGQSYGYLENYSDHYAEHYVDKSLFNIADATLTSAFNFNITDWTPDRDGRDFGHQWPLIWYTRSVEFPDRTGDILGFSLSLAGGREEFCTLAEQFPPGGECQLRSVGSAAFCGNIVTPTSCR